MRVLVGAESVLSGYPFRPSTDPLADSLLVALLGKDMIDTISIYY